MLKAGQGQSDTANTCESLQRREIRQAKGADMPGPKGLRTGTGADVSPVADVVPPAYGRGLSHLYGIYAKRGKPDRLHNNKNGNQTVRQGERRVGKGGRKKRMSCCNGANRDSEFVPA